MINDTTATTSTDEALVTTATKTEPEPEGLESPRPCPSPPVWLRAQGGTDSPGPFEDIALVPRSSSSLETTTIATGWSDLFLKEATSGPPARPQTPPPETSTYYSQSASLAALGMTMAPAQPKPIRKSSEAVAIDKLFESLGQGSLGQPVGRSSSPLLIESNPSSFTDALGISPLIKQPGNEEEIFQTDLANVLVWFEKSLTSSQRITTAFTLFERLTTWQREFVLGMLKTTEVTASVRNQAHVINTERAGEAPPGFDNNAEQPVYQPQQHQQQQKSLVGLKFEQNQTRPSSTPPHYYQQYQYSTLQNFSARRSPSPLHHQQQRTYPSYHQKQYQSYYHHSNQSNVSLVTTSSMDSTFSASSELTLDQCNVELFKRDIPQWLRSLRLHKYTPAVGGLTQETLLASTDESLERHGVAALGARRKLLRIFETIQNSMSQNNTTS